MSEIREVLRLGLELNLKKREIARITGVTRDSVTAYLTRAELMGIKWPLPDGTDDRALEEMLFPPRNAQQGDRLPEPDWSVVDKELRKKGATIQVLHAEYLQEHPNGMKYSRFCESLREYRQTLKRYWRQAYIGGDRLFNDFAGATIPILNLKTGERHDAQIFCAALGASHYVYAEAVWSQKIEDWLAAHARMFEFFGGVTAVVVCDNLKAAVSKADRYEPEIHPAYLGLARHYGTKIIPARPMEPQDKAKAEKAVQIVTNWIIFRLRKQIFTDLAELNRAIAALLEELNNRKVKRMNATRQELFELLDKPALRPLPRQRYQYAEFKLVRVGLDCHVEYDNHHYSAPYTLVRQEVELCVTADLVEIRSRGRAVTSHPRSHAAGGYTTNPLHLDPNHRFYATWAAQNELAWAQGVGPAVHGFLKKIFDAMEHKEDGYRPSQAIKKLEREFGAARLNVACQRALDKGADRPSFVRSILKNNLDRTAPASQPAADPAPSHSHANIRGPGYYR